MTETAWILAYLSESPFIGYCVKIYQFKSFGKGRNYDNFKTAEISCEWRLTLRGFVFCKQRELSSKAPITSELRFLDFGCEVACKSYFICRCDASKIHATHFASKIWRRKCRNCDKKTRLNFVWGWRFLQWSRFELEADGLQITNIASRFEPRNR